jgi:hypothetical protein
LSKAVSNEEAVLKADRRGTVVFKVLMSANGQAYAQKQNHPPNKGKLAQSFQLTKIQIPSDVSQKWRF